MREDIESIDVALVETGGGTQSRARLDDQTLEDYVKAWQLGAQFPPIEVYFDGQKYWLADGFHRSESFKRAGKGRHIDAVVHQGTRRDAILHSVGANASHGLRRTNPDKRRAVLTLLRDEEWSRWSNQAIAKACGVDESLIRSIKTELSSVKPKMEEETQLAKKCGVGVDELREAKSKLGSTPVTRRATRNGSTYDIDTSAIGKSKQQSSDNSAETEIYIYKGTGAWGILKNQKFFLEPNTKVILASASLTDPSQAFVRMLDQPGSAIQVNREDLKLQILDIAEVKSAADLDFLIDCVGLVGMLQQFAEAEPEMRQSIRKFYPGIYSIVADQLGEDIAMRLEEEDLKDAQSVESLPPQTQTSNYPFKIGDRVELLDPPPDSGWSPGDRVAIHEIDYNTRTIYLKLDEHQAGKKFKSFGFDEVRLASKWRVGDRVQAPDPYQDRTFVVREVYETGMVGVTDLENNQRFSFPSDDLRLAIDIPTDQSTQTTQVRNTFDALKECFGDYEIIREISDKDKLPNKPLYLCLRNGYEDLGGFICNSYWQGKIKEFIFNVPAQTHTSAWQEIADSSTGICFTRERGVVLFYFGVNFEKFQAAFESLGLILKRHK